MRIFFSLLLAAITAGLIIILNTKILLPGPLGKWLAPQHGFWQNAEPVDKDFSEDLHLPGIEGNVNIYLDERLVPHVFAEKEKDAWFAQGYLHAKFRLWQMELQTLSAAGRVSEVVGEVALDHDREFRRLGMVYAAENSLREMEKDESTRAMCDAYTAGVNSYISSLTESTLPIEYKLLGYYPEKWSNLKSALFLKYMSFDLAGADKDFEMTNARNYFSPEDFAKLFPSSPDIIDPVIPVGTIYPKPGLTVVPPAFADSLYLNSITSTPEEVEKPDRSNGSNNWAIAGGKTKSGYPILCNDPHLGLNLPSLWYEMQISTPAFNSYGVSFPGSPGIIIGFNDSCAFGFTNGGRDVRDYYEIRFRDDSRSEYWFNNDWQKTEFRVEKIRITGKPDYYDTVAYTLFGPVMYDEGFGGKRSGNNKNYSVRWKAHDPSNELLMFNQLDRARNYADYSAAISHLQTPGQNCLFASRGGDIALYTQGQFPAKWKGQGDFIMPGEDSSYMWQGNIPLSETPFQYNPERCFVSSANQLPTDSAYPYYLGRDYPSVRGLLINKRLNSMDQITMKDMMALQTDNYNYFAELSMPFITRYMNEKRLSGEEKNYYHLLTQWNLKNDPDSKGAAIFEIFWKDFYKLVYADEYAKAPTPVAYPLEMTLVGSILKDSAYKFLDNIETITVETLEDNLVTAFKNATLEFTEKDKEGALEWGKTKDTYINHLLRLPAFSRLHVFTGGGIHCINATKDKHGPSWRMVVSLEPDGEAYGVFPGGQSGNPGSLFFDDFVDQWASGEYYKLWMMKKGEERSEKIRSHISIHRIEKN